MLYLIFLMLPLSLFPVKKITLPKQRIFSHSFKAMWSIADPRDEGNCYITRFSDCSVHLSMLQVKHIFKTSVCIVIDRYRKLFWIAWIAKFCKDWEGGTMSLPSLNQTVCTIRRQRIHIWVSLLLYRGQLRPCLIPRWRAVSEEPAMIFSSEETNKLPSLWLTWEQENF